MEFVFELIFEIFIGGIFHSIYYLISKYFKHKASDKILKIVAGTLTGILIISTIAIIIFLLSK